MRRTFSYLLLAHLVPVGGANAGDTPKARPAPVGVGEPNVADLGALLAAHNRERAEAKLPPLASNPLLDEAALEHARDMAVRDVMTHTGGDGSTPAERVERRGYHFRTTGENVAAGQRNVAEVVRAWMESPPHRKNLLGDFNEMGSACVEAKDGTRYWCVDFGTPWPVLDPAEAGAAVVSALNVARKGAGQPPLRVNLKLEAAARRHARDNAKVGSLKSEDSDGLAPFQRVQKAGYRFRRLGEAAASGQPSASEVVRTWLEDRVNRESILGDFGEVGVGYATAEKGTPFWCLLLGKPSR